MQYLNIMTELEINKLATMLSSEDTEIREIALNILINKYDLDFDMRESLDEGPDSHIVSKKEVHILKYIIL